jgi:hypothetical protein
MDTRFLSTWFTVPIDKSGPNDDEVRETILMEVSKATAYAEENGAVLFDCATGRALFHHLSGTPLLDREPMITTVEYVEKGRWLRTRFWMNTSSVRDLMENRKNLPMVDFEDLFFTG